MSTLQVSNIIGPTTIDASTANATSLAVTGGASVYRKTNTGNVDNSLTVGTTNKASSSSNYEGYVHIKSNDATNQLRGWMRLVTDSTQANRRLAIDAYEDNIAARNVTLAESGGNVGIGTGSPDYKLDIVTGSGQYTTAINIQESTHATSNRAAIYIGSWLLNQDISGNGSKNFGIYDSNAPSTRFFISTNGDVGIGTINPASKLDVTGNTNITGSLAVSSNTIVTGSLTVGTSASGGITPLTDGATITPDFAVRNNFSVTLAGNRTLTNPNNPAVGQSGIIYITQDGTGSRTLAYGSYWKFPGGTAPTLTTTAAAVDALVYTVRSATSITVNSVLNIG